ncbi:MAG: aminopeptidase [Armatimonadota bacterium]
MQDTKKGSVEYGAMQAVKNCLRLQPGEKVVIITDKETKFISDQILKNCEEVSPGNTQIFIMEDYGSRPEDGTNPLKFPEVIGEALKTADVSFYCAQGKKGELKTFRIPMLEIVDANKKLRHGHMPGINKLLMETGMSVNYDEVQKLSKKIYDIVKTAKKIRVTTPAGTDFTTYFNPGWKWMISDGLITPEHWSNLPDGEIFTCAESIPEGTIVIDGTLGDYFCQQYGSLENNPVTIKIKDSRVVDIQCSNVKLAGELKEYIKQDENANRIGEFAIGTNTGLDKLVGNLLQDEKFPGIHVAMGHGYPEKTGSDWSSEAHVDGVLKNCTIIVEDTPIMKDGKFII